MRVLGFLKKWSKLNQDIFTTFRYQRKDRDWEVGEIVQIVFHPRSKDREFLCYGAIFKKDKRSFTPSAIYWNPKVEEITNDEAIVDGFSDRGDMVAWMKKTYGDSIFEKPINKLTLRRIDDVSLFDVTQTS